MKKTLKSLAMLAFAALAVSSCQKENLRENEVTPGKQIEISVNGLMGEYQVADATKADLVNTVRVAWTGGEKVYAYTTSGLLGTLTASLDGAEDRYAKLSGTITDPGAKTVTLVYSPQFTEAPSLNGTLIKLDISEQDGEKIPFVVYGTLDSKDLTVSNAIVPFKFATSVMKVNCTGLAEGKEIASATVNNLNTVCELTLFDNSEATVNGKTTGTITRKGTNAFSKVDNRAIFQMAMVKTNGASSARTLAVTVGSGDNQKSYSANFCDSSIKTGSSYNGVFQLVLGDVYFEYTADEAVTFPQAWSTYRGGFREGNGWIALPATATEIPDNAFNSRNTLKSVKIPSQIKSINFNAFSGSTSLAEVEFADESSLESIGEGAFYSCSSLKSISFPEESRLKSIGGSAFMSSGLESLTIPAEVTEIGNAAFMSCTLLAEVEFASGSKLKTVGPSAFFLAGLKSITLPASVTEIGSGAFFLCSSLETVTVHATVPPVMPYDAFSASGVKKIIVPVGTVDAYKAAAGWSTYKDIITDGTKPDVLAGEFSVSATKKVLFSQGNLWADGSNALHFEANQYSSASSWDASHVSHFTWSSTVAAAVGNTNSGDNLFCDESHKVSVDGGEAIYYALSTAEWQYLINTTSRMVNSKPCYSNAVSGVSIESVTYNGVFLYPDNYNGDIVSSSMTWNDINAAGIVFLPAAGDRVEGSYDVTYVGDDGYYWSSTAYDSGYAYRVYFYRSNVYPDSFESRSYGHSVRLVTDVPAE